MTVYPEALANRHSLVRRIVDDLVVSYADWQHAVSRFEYATTKSTATNPDPEAGAAGGRARGLKSTSYVHELAQLGVEVRAFDIGLVIFQASATAKPARSYGAAKMLPVTECATTPSRRPRRERRAPCRRARSRGMGKLRFALEI